MSTTAHDAFLSEAAARRPTAPFGQELRRPGEDCWTVILPNPAPGQGPYKVQYFTAAGLAGHRAYATPQAALRAAQREGYTELDPGTLHRLSHTPAWQVRYEMVLPPAPAIEHSIPVSY